MLTQQSAVSTQSLAAQVHSLSAAPSPAFTAAQASSYDRASTKPGDDSWFANGDWGKYLRQEGKEFVMADLQGPGAITRIWSANPKGTLRIYFDGEKEARIAVKMATWVEELKAAFADRPDFADEFAFWADRGWNVYLPMPYASSVKVTMEPDAGDNPNMYYQVGYRTYASGTPVRTFLKSDIKSIVPVAPDVTGNSISKVATLPASADSQTVSFKGPGMLSQLSVKWPEGAAGEKFHQQLRRIWVKVKFDGEETISAPLGDLMAAPFGTRMKSKGKEINDLYLNYDMAFTKGAVFTFEQQIDPSNVDVQIGFVGRHKKAAEVKGAYLFHADFSRDRGNTRPMRDMNWLTATGEGYLAGCHLLVTNGSKSWWGEGDEKIFIDGETFPSFFGTGTEDFLNYAWSSPTRYWTSQGSQNYSTGIANYGYCNISRFMRRDPIPFKKSIQFDVEMWHWAATEATFDRMAYWYGKPGSAAVRQPRPTWSELQLPDMSELPSVKGAIEGEKLTHTKTGGETETQEGFAETSGMGQLWWTKVSIGDELTITVPFKDGEYDLVMNACMAKDYGIHQIYWNGEVVGSPIDFYNPEIIWKQISLGRVRIEGGKATLRVRCVG
ncbi:MAG TPA: DUF2961 domain-containing protein, partial [Fimbriimonas sp.]|nr:DUF2961 domain-containing protein [Fimbriimonas sp.]